jgi:DNA-directed RNA polymerase alpha subunit
VLLYPIPELPDDTPLDHVQLETRIRNMLNSAGIKTVGEVRESSDETLLSFQDLGKISVTYLRETLDLPSSDGASGKKRV